ncbi:hypothetical protein JCM3774_004388 [Rhodotorula dairenensis]
MAAPAWPGVPDVFTFPSFSEPARPLVDTALGRRESPFSALSQAQRGQQAPTDRRDHPGRAQEDSDQATEKAPDASHSNVSADLATRSNATFSLAGIGRAQEQQGVPAWAPLETDAHISDVFEGSTETKKRDQDALAFRVLSGDALPFDPVVGQPTSATSPRNVVADPQPRAVGSPAPPGRESLGKSASPRYRWHEPTAQPLDAFSSDDSHSASWIWPLRPKVPVRSGAAQQGSRSDESAAAASGSTQSSPTRLGGALNDLSRENEGALHTQIKAPISTRYVFLQNLRPGLSEEEFGFRFQALCRGLSLRGCFTGHLASFGHAVLVFGDPRHSTSVLHRLGLIGQSEKSLLFMEQGASARCVTREAFEQLVGSGTENPLMSASEGVLVLTLRGPTSTPDFTPLPLLATFGEIRGVKVIERGMHVVEYWDDRAAETAMSILAGRESGGAKFGCTFEPNIASTSPLAWEFAFEPQVKPYSAAAVDEPRSGLEREPPAQAQNAQSSPPLWRTKTFEALGTITPRASPHKPTPDEAEVPLKDYRFPPQPRRSPGTPAGSPTRGLERGKAPRTAQPGRPGARLPSEYGLVRDDKIPVGNMLNFDRIERGLDVRTTLMIKNIPNKMKDLEVMQYIEEVVGRTYDFFYLRCDYSNDCNVGYGFVNFVSTTALLEFARARLGTRWNKCGSDKLCVLSYANIQGKPSLINHFKNSSVLDQDENRRPKLFVTEGPHAGEPEPFPACDDPLRKARSAMNASNVGLFPSAKPVFKIAHALQSMHI